MQPLGENLASTRKVAPMVTQKECLERFPTLNTSTTINGWEHADSQFPIRITRSWANRIQSLSDPLAKQVFPQSAEMTPLRFTDSLENPVGEQEKIPVPFVVQKHDNRALLLVSRKCHLHCRYCFRRTLDDLVEPSKIISFMVHNIYFFVCRCYSKSNDSSSNITFQLKMDFSYMSVFFCSNYWLGMVLYQHLCIYVCGGTLLLLN